MCVAQKPFLLALLPPSERSLPTLDINLLGSLISGERASSLEDLFRDLAVVGGTAGQTCCVCVEVTLAPSSPGSEHSNRGHTLPGVVIGQLALTRAQLELDSLYCTRRCRLRTVILQAPRADPRKTTGNVSDAGAGMMHDTDEDKVTTDYQLVVGQETPHRFTNTSAAPERFCSAVPVLVFALTDPSTTHCLFAVNFLPFCRP